MKNSGIEWIGEIPDSWKVMRLKEAIESHFGGCWGEEASEDDGILCIRIADFDFDRQTIKSSASTKRQYSTAQLEKGLLQDGDLILEKSGGGEKTSVGRVVVFEQKMFPCKAMFANFSECLRLKRNLHNEKYCAYLLKALYYTKEMSCFYRQTTGIQNLDIAEYLSMDLCFPSRKEQDVIVDCLNEKLTEVDKLIEVQQAQIEKLKEYKQSVITEAVTKGLDPTAPMKDSGVEWIGNIPEGWEVRRGKSIFRQRNEKGNAVCLQLLSPTQRYGVIPQELYDKISGMTAVKLSLSVDLATMKTIHKGDYCISLRSFQGGFEYSMYEGVVSPAYQVFYAYEKISDGYYKYLFKEKGFISEMNSFTLTIRDGKNISFGDFADSMIVYPPISVQQQIVDYLDNKCAKIDKLIALKQSKIDKLQEYKKSLIYEYVTGKKEIV